MRQDKTIFWLKFASLLVIGFGLIVSLAAHPASAGLPLILTDLMFWPMDGEQSLSRPETRLLCAILGGVMVGWGVLFWLISAKLYYREPELSRSMIYWSIGIWFVTDSLGSIVAGVPINAFLNIGFLVAFVLPLWRSSKIATT